MKTPYILVEPWTLTPLLLLALPLSACAEITLRPAVDCGNEAVVSVNIGVIDTSSAPLAAEVFYDDGSGEEACVDWGEDRYACGFDVDGELVIRVSAPGYEEQAIPVTIENDTCGIVGQSLLVELIEERS